METNNYEMFLIAVPQHSTLQEEFYDFITEKAGNCMAGAIAFEDLTDGKVKEIMENIVRKGVEASGIQTK